MCRSIFCVKPQKSSVPARTRENGARLVARPQDETVIAKKEIARNRRAERKLGKKLTVALSKQKLVLLAKILRLTSARKMLTEKVRATLIHHDKETYHVSR